MLIDLRLSWPRLVELIATWCLSLLTFPLPLQEASSGTVERNHAGCILKFKSSSMSVVGITSDRDCTTIHSNLELLVVIRSVCFSF